MKPCKPTTLCSRICQRKLATQQPGRVAGSNEGEVQRVGAVGEEGDPSVGMLNLTCLRATK